MRTRWATSALPRIAVPARPAPREEAEGVDDDVFQGRSPTVTGTGKRLKAALSAEQIESVGTFLVGVAASNGAIEEAEIAALRSATRALGIEPLRLDRLIAEQRRLASDPVEVSRQRGHPGGGTNPPRAARGARAEIRLDPALLERLMDQTRRRRACSTKRCRSEQPEEEEGEGEGGGAERAFTCRFGTGRRPSLLRSRLTAPFSRGPRRAVHPALMDAGGDFETLVRKHSLDAFGRA